MGGYHAGDLFNNGSDLVCGCHCAIHLTCEQPQVGVGMFSTRRTTQVFGYPGAALHRIHDILVDGLLCVHDKHPAGTYDAMGNCTACP